MTPYRIDRPFLRKIRCTGAFVVSLLAAFSLEAQAKPDIIVVSGSVAGSPNPGTPGGQVTVSYSVRNKALPARVRVPRAFRSNGTPTTRRSPIRTLQRRRSPLAQRQTSRRR